MFRVGQHKDCGGNIFIEDCALACQLCGAQDWNETAGPNYDENLADKIIWADTLEPKTATSAISESNERMTFLEVLQSGLPFRAVKFRNKYAGVGASAEERLCVIGEEISDRTHWLYLTDDGVILDIEAGSPITIEREKYLSLNGWRWEMKEAAKP